MPKNKLLASIIFSCIIAYLLTFIVHGYVHNLVAYIYGLNETPWEIIDNTKLWLQNVHENGEFMQLDQQGYFFKIGMIGLSGYVSNLALLLFALFNLHKAHGHLINFFFWLAIWNLTLIFGYIPHHLFHSTNVNLIFEQMGISVWMIYVIGVIFALFILLYMFYILMPEMMVKLRIKALSHRRLYFTLVLLLVLFYSTTRYVFVHEDYYLPGSHLHNIITNPLFYIKLFIFAIVSYSVKFNRKQ